MSKLKYFAKILTAVLAFYTILSGLYFIKTGRNFFSSSGQNFSSIAETNNFLVTFIVIATTTAFLVLGLLLHDSYDGSTGEKKVDRAGGNNLTTKPETSTNLTKDQTSAQAGEEKEQGPETEEIAGLCLICLG